MFVPDSMIRGSPFPVNGGMSTTMIKCSRVACSIRSDPCCSITCKLNRFPITAEDVVSNEIIGYCRLRSNACVMTTRPMRLGCRHAFDKLSQKNNHVCCLFRMIIF